MTRVVQGWIALTLWACVASANAASTPFTLITESTQDYDLYPGDFNGDGFTDLLYIAKNPSNASGIILSDGTNLGISFQTWSSTYLGISWSSGAYNVVVADFNGDGKADILLQSKTPGDSYLLLTGNTGITAISQTIAVDTAGVTWSADQHAIIAGDFNGDGKADIFLQATSPAGLNAVITSDANGEFTATQPAQSWNDGYLGFGWATTEANIFAGDFNGDGYADLLLQAQPTVGTGPGSPQPAQFLPNLNGVVLAQHGATIFAAAGVQAWSQYGFSADWSPLDSGVVLGNFNGDNRVDAILQGLTSTNPTYLLYGNAPGPIFSTATTLSSELYSSADYFHLIPGHFDSAPGDGLFMQSQIRGQSNYLGRVNGGSITGGVPPVPPPPPAPTGGKSATTLAPPGVAGAIVTPTAAGRTPAHFSVASDGSAVYTIPLQTPPGAGGAQLQLALAYNSRSPNGTMGMGWGVGGLSAITRCNKTVAQDGAAGPVTLQQTDRICLDGKQLKLTSGTVPNYVVVGNQYATEVETFSQVIANGSSSVTSFTVKTKNGLIYTYGGTTDSEVLAGTSGTIRTWALSQIADRVGNKISLTYQQSNGTYRIDHILYPTTASGQGPFYKVLFTYGARPSNDIPSAYVDGYLVTEPNQLNSVTTEVNPAGTVIKVYNLAYTQSTTTNRNTLTALQECSASTCLPPTDIVYQGGAKGWPSTASGSVTSVGALTDLWADLNGDGLPDLVSVALTSPYHIFVQFGTPTGFAAAVDTGFATPGGGNTPNILAVGKFVGNGEQQVLFAQPNGNMAVLNYSAGSFSSIPLTLTVPVSVCAADIDGDGLDDLIELPIGTGTIVALHNTTVPPGTVQFGSPVTIWTAPSGQGLVASGQFGIEGGVTTADFNGDGRADILAITQNPTNHNTYATPLISNGASSAFTAEPQWQVNYSDKVTPPNPFIIDWNGDGCSDVVLIDGISNLTIEESNCAGGFTPIVTSITANTVAAAASVDWDGDGRQDLLYETTTSYEVLLSTGTGTGASYALPNFGEFPTILDLNGDGLPDLASLSSTRQSFTYFYHSGVGTPPDLAISFTDGFGMNQSPTYAPITNSAYYEKYTNAIYPEVDYDQPLYVIGQFTASDGTGATYQDQFLYEGARRQVQGRGFEGFYTRRMYDSRNGLYTWDFSGQTFPYTGMIVEHDVYSATNELQHWIGTPSNQTETGLGGYQTRSFPYIGSETTTLWETGGSKNGAQISQSTKTTTYGDGYGNPTTVVISTTDTDSTAPASPFNGLTWTQTLNATFYNDTTHNCLGLPDTLSDQRVVPGQTTQTRNFSYLADTTNCRTTQKTIEPGVSGLQVTTAYSFDTCGNISLTGVTGENPDGSAMTTRSTAYNYSYSTSRCQLPEQITNAAGETITIAYNYNFGVPSTVTDSNTLVTSYVQDDYGRNTQVTRPDGTYTTTNFYSCSASECWNVTNLHFYVLDIDYGSDSSLINENERFYDGFNRLRYDESYRSNGLGNATVWNIDAIHLYDSLGRQINQILPYSTNSNGYLQWSYDVLNRKLTDQIYQPNGTLDRTTTTAYLGRTIQTTDPLSNTVSRITDVVGHLREVIDPSPGGTTRYAFDAFGNLNNTVDAIGTTSSATFNLRGFRTQMVDPDMGTWNYTGDSLNELVSWKDAKSQSFSAGYDLLGRVTSRTEPEGTSTWTWGSSPSSHNVDRLQQVTGYGYTENLTYDSVARLSNRSIVSDQTYLYQYAYNTQGLLFAVTYPVSPVPTGTTGTYFQIEYSYVAGEPVEIQDVTNSPNIILWTSNSNTDARLPATETLGSGTAAVSLATGYKVWTNEILSIQAGTGGSTTNLQNLGYTWDTGDNLMERGDANQSGTCTINGSSSKLCESFTPDSLNRLASSTLNGASNLTVAYDGAGDITSKSDVGTYTYPSPTGSHPHGATAAGSNSYTYDSNGNVATKNGLTQSWASYNLPTTLEGSPSGTAYTSQFSYGPEHDRYKEVAAFSDGTETTEFVGEDLEKVTASLTGVTYWRHFVKTPSGEAVIVSRNSDYSTSKSFVLTDHLGSSDTVVNGLTGALILKDSSSPFGQRRESNWTAGVPSTWYQTALTEGTRRGFTFHEQLDGVGFIHMNGRVYDPTVGRFLSVDPDSGDGRASQRLNPYAYVNNRPLVSKDPTGLAPWDAYSADWISAWEPRARTIFSIPGASSYGTQATVTISNNTRPSLDTSGSDTSAQQTPGGAGLPGANNTGNQTTPGSQNPQQDDIVVTAHRLDVSFDFAARAAMYQGLDQFLRNYGGRYTDFFAAASMVNYNLAKSAFLGKTSEKTLDYLDQLGASLVTTNTAWFYSLASGGTPDGISPSDSSTQALDYALVSAEQSRVTEFSQTYFKGDPLGWAAARSEISGSLNMESAGAFNNPFTSIMQRQGILPFDYGNQAQRVLLGQGITDYVAGR